MLFDDGKITCRVEEVHPRHVVLTVISADETGSKLRADKGINLPDTNLHLDALTDKDLEDLAFVVEHADMVEYSFVRRAEDVQRLQAELARLGRPDLPIVMKIENRQAFQHLPSLMLAAMQSPVSGVMIARGDLAVEIGWQRLAEVQEEILWMCEAAHMPVVWATQVLENLTKNGIPSRAEITDAAMSVRAECVMLNKGPHIVETVRMLGDILRRMQDHQVKKRPLMRRLKLADDLTPEPDASVNADPGRLSVLKNLSEINSMIRSKGGSEPTDLPSFVWVVRNCVAHNSFQKLKRIMPRSSNHRFSSTFLHAIKP